MRMIKNAELKLSYADMDRLLKRQEFSSAYVALNQKVRGFAPSYFQAFKFAFYKTLDTVVLMVYDGTDLIRIDANQKRTIQSSL